MIREYKVVLRGTFDRPLAQLHEELGGPEKVGASAFTGFDATRFVEAENAAEAIAKA
jgi:RHS repeat-associated protein